MGVVSRAWYHDPQFGGSLPWDDSGSTERDQGTYNDHPGAVTFRPRQSEFSMRETIRATMSSLLEIRVQPVLRVRWYEMWTGWKDL